MGGPGSGPKKGSLHAVHLGEALRKRPYEAQFNKFQNIVTKAGHVTELTYEDFLDIVKIGKCHYCDLPLIWAAHNASTQGKGYQIDRVDNSKGYLKSNCVPCCKLCNQAKSKLPVTEFLNWIERVYKSLKRKSLVA